MAERDRFMQRGNERGGAGGQRPERAGAFSGEPGGQRGGRGEFGGHGGGATGRGGRGPGRGTGGGQHQGSGPSRGEEAMPYGRSGGEAGFGAEDPAHRWGEGDGSARERWESGGGTVWSGSSALGRRTDTGYGAGGTAYGAPGVARNRGPKGWHRSDERIHDDVCERLASEQGIDPSDVTVEVRDGDVVLAGTVPDRVMKYRIEDIVDGCSGVRDVDNRLRVSRASSGGFLGGAAGPLGTASDARQGRGGSRGSLLGRLFGFTGGSRLSDIMTRNPRTVGPDETLTQVAQAMKEQDVGAIPVCTGRTLTGMITDRDIVVRAVAGGKALDQTKVSEVMTTRVHACHEDEEVESALDRMGDLQVRRIPVIDRANQLVGIVSLGDFSQRGTGDVEGALQDISKPVQAA
jgi:CBS domain-containing protein